MTHAIIPCNFSQWFTLLDALKNGRPLSHRYFPVRVWAWAALFAGEFIGRVPVDQNIISAWEQFLKGDE